MSPDLPSGWKRLTLGELTQISGGATPSKAELQFWDNGSICWATPTDITALPPEKHIIEFTKNLVSEAALRGSSIKMLPVGAVMMTSRATIGYAAINAVPMTTNQGFANFLPSPSYDPMFLVYWITSKRTELERAAGGSTFLEVSKAVLRSYSIDLPPLPEQQRIVEILSSVDDAIAATRAVIEQTRKVKQGVMERLLTKGIGHTRFKQTEIGEIPEEWDLMRLRDVTAFITSGSRGWAKFYSNEGHLFLRSQNVRNGALDLSDKQFVAVPRSAEGSRTLVQAGDLVLTITGNSVGNVARIPEDLGDAYVSQHVALARLKNKELSDFLVAYFSPSGPGNEQILRAQYGQSKPGLSLENVRSLYVPVPPGKELTRLNEMVAHHNVYERSLEKELSLLLSLKSALMSDLLTGRKRAVGALAIAAK